MTSADVYGYIKNNNVKELYKIFKPSFDWVDKWADTLIHGDVLDENELAFMIDKSTGIFAKLSPVVNALESYVDRGLYNEESKFYSSIEKIRTQDTAVAKANARAIVSDVRDYLGDFKGYMVGATQMICSAQSRIKRLTVEKGAKGIAYTGEVPVNSNEPQRVA